MNPELVIHDEQGKPFTVRYEAVNAMLLNEFLKEHRRVEEQEQNLQNQGKKIAEQQKANRSFDGWFAKAKRAN